MKTSERTFLAIVIIAGLAVCACEQPGRQPALTIAQQQELQTLTEQLVDPGRSSRTKLDAAVLLLNRPYREATDTLVGLLGNPGNPAAQRAVAEALARHGGQNKAFVKPLMKLLDGQDATLRAAAGRALASYSDPAVVGRLTLVAIDQRKPKTVRLVAIRSLSLVLDKRAVATAIQLLDDSDSDIRQSAADTLIKLTNIRSFGNDADEWKLWWSRNRDKKRTEWLADLADRLGRAKAGLERENAVLRERLIRTTAEVYSATPSSARETILMDLLNDPLADIRLVGTRLTDRRLTGGEPVSPEVTLRLRAMLSDSDSRVRASSAMLLANLADAESLPIVLGRLEIERDNTARQGLLTALGRLGSLDALPAVLAEITSENTGVSTAAAAALARIVELHALSGSVRREAVDALIDRYERAAQSTDGARLREALLTAMSKIPDRAIVRVLRGAVTDQAATVRLAAVGALAGLGNGDSAQMLSPLVADSDRGVRQAAITAIGTLAGKEHLSLILTRTDPAVEPDAAVRKQAWAVATQILSDAAPDTLERVAGELANRPDAAAQRIQILQMLVAALQNEEPAVQGAAQRDLGLALASGKRPAEAAVHLGEAWKLYDQAKHPDAIKVWDEWLDALLAGDDATAVRVMNGQTDAECFNKALARLIDRLQALRGEKQYASAKMIALAVLRELPHRLGDAERQTIEQLLAEVNELLQAEDKSSVVRLVSMLTSSDENVRRSAADELRHLGPRSVEPLLDALDDCLNSEKLDTGREAAIIAVLSQIAPELNGYSADAAVPEKLRKIRTWRNLIP